MTLAPSLVALTAATVLLLTSCGGGSNGFADPDTDTDLDAAPSDTEFDVSDTDDAVEPDGLDADMDVLPTDADAGLDDADAQGDATEEQDGEVGGDASDDGPSDVEEDVNVDADDDSDASEDATADVERDADPDIPDAAPDGYTETDAYGELVDAELIAALHDELSASHNSMSYGDARDQMYAVGGIDDQDGRIECLYTGRTVVTDGTRVPSTDCRLIDGSPSTCAFNTEHTWPRSRLQEHLGSGAVYNTAEADIHHIFPTEETINNQRGNLDFGDSQCLDDTSCQRDEESQIGLRVGSDGDPNCVPTNTECVMDVRPLRHGDVARAQFYMAVRYNMPIGSVVEDTLRFWHAIDPPDAREVARNDAVEPVQGNRNPFVDHPDLVDRIADF